MYVCVVQTAKLSSSALLLLQILPDSCFNRKNLREVTHFFINRLVNWQLRRREKTAQWPHPRAFRALLAFQSGRIHP